MNMSCKDKALTMPELRKVCTKIYPTAKNLHMDTIAELLLSTDFKQVNRVAGNNFDYYAVKHITNGCKLIRNKKDKS